MRPDSTAIRRTLILLFGIVNACLYSALLPLWEGFDEPFHYAYVESLRESHRLPALGRSFLTGDVFRSFEFAPMSYLIHEATGQGITYEAWSTLPQDEKEARRAQLDALRPQPEGDRPNYEAQHPPLAHLILAVLDQPMSTLPLTTRVLVLRTFGAIAAVLLLWLGATSLSRTLAVPETFTGAALFTLFSSQMLFATIAHVANDWLAVGISAMFLASLAAFVTQPTRRSATLTALWLAAGLVTKAYFLAFALTSLIVVLVLLCRKLVSVRTLLPGALIVFVIATPWYVRNQILYGNFIGTREAYDGVGVRQTLAAIPHINWPASIAFIARGSLWTGNNSFTTFSRLTLNIVLLLLLAALAAWALRRRDIRRAELAVFGTIVVFALAVAYHTAAEFAHTHGATPGASPWYTQAVLAPVLVLSYLGMSRWQRLGPVLAAATLVLWTWILIATWTIKLFPLYSGAGAAPMHVRGIMNWYMHDSIAHARDLSLLALAPAGLLYSLMLLSIALSLVLAGRLLSALWGRMPFLRGGCQPPHAGTPAAYCLTVPLS
jgi:hypothetical protein